MKDCESVKFPPSRTLQTVAQETRGGSQIALLTRNKTHDVYTSTA